MPLRVSMAADNAPRTQHGMRHKGEGPAGQTGGEHAAGYAMRFWICLALTLPVLILSPDVQRLLGARSALQFSGDIYILWAISSAVFFYGGFPFLLGFVGEMRSKAPGMMTLIALAIALAYVYSTAVAFGLAGREFFWELATLIDIMLLGHWLEMRSVMAATSALEQLARLLPGTAHRLGADGSTEDIKLEFLAAGDKVIVKPGEKIPADGLVTQGESLVNEALLTGESQPVRRGPGSGVIGGAVNGEGSITVRISRTGEESYLARVGALVREAGESKSKSQTLADAAALWLIFVAIVAGALTLLGWSLLSGLGFSFSLERAVTVMIITCPHALGLAVPLVVAVSTALAARNGLLIKNRSSFESARNTQAVLFDKTGTLTEGQFAVSDVVVMDKGMDEAGLLKYAASVEARSEHLIARGIVSSAPETYPVEGFKSIPGKGASGMVNGRQVEVVSPGYLGERGMASGIEQADRLAAQGKTVVFVLVDGVPAGAIALDDVVRIESKEAVRRLKERGIRCMMITGDNAHVAARVAAETGIDEYFSGVLPHEKVERVKEVQSRGLVVAMVGDGVNDAPALARADIGIAIGAGTDVVAGAADIVLVKNNLLDVVSALELSRATYNKMLQNLAWATGYNILAIPLAAGALYGLGLLLSPAVGAALMSLSTIIVAVNARGLKVTGFR